MAPPLVRHTRGIVGLVPLELEACERRIYAPDTPYTSVVVREVPLLLAEIRRLRALAGGST